jgi:hypothetical protein
MLKNLNLNYTCQIFSGWAGPLGLEVVLKFKLPTCNSHGLAILVLLRHKRRTWGSKHLEGSSCLKMGL